METIKNNRSGMINAFKFILITILLSSYSVEAQNPGNVSANLQLWMKANAGTSTTTDGQTVNTWTDNSSNSLTATKESSSGPRYKENSINFNPALNFTGSQHFTLGQPSALDITPTPTASNASSMSIFAAFLTDQSGAGTLISKGDNSHGRSFQLWLGDTDRVVHYTLGREEGSGQNDTESGINYGTTHARNDPKISSAVINITTPTPTAGENQANILRYVNGYLDPLSDKDNGDNGFGNGEHDVDVLIGARRNSYNTGYGNRVKGDIGEIIIYDRALTHTEKQKVETYLAIKYGITLGYNDEIYKEELAPDLETFGYSGTSNNYILSNGSIAWTGSANAGYGYNVFGVARDDNSALLQLKSKSVHVEEFHGTYVDGTDASPRYFSVLTMEDESASITNDRDYLLVGNNGVTVELQSSVLPERTSATINRVWKARESSNDVGTVKLDFDLSQYNISNTDAQDLELIISSNSDLTNYKNYFGTYNSSTKTVTFSGVDLDDAEYFTLAKLDVIQSSYEMDFNGTSRYVDLEDNLDLGNSFTVSVWVNRGSGSTNTSILSKTNAANQGYDFKITAGAARFIGTWKNSLGLNQSIQAGTILPENEWHHLAITYSGGTANLYVDGILDITKPLDSPTNTSFSAMIGAANASNPTRHFNGALDELRVWDIALEPSALRYIMNQEITENASMVQGRIMPTSVTKDEVSTIPWANLKAYYPFSYVRGNCLTNQSSFTSQNGRLFNTPSSSLKTQTAPLPYRSSANGDWNDKSTWLYGSSQTIPGDKSLADNSKTVDWNIVISSHDISMDNTDLPGTIKGNRTVCGLFVESNEITLIGDNSTNTGNGITITHYLALNGKIDLEGDSQLIQTKLSDFDVRSSGTIQKINKELKIFIPIIIGHLQLE